jgi:hypothetical protein
MKYFSLALLVVIILVIAIFATSLIDKDSIENNSITKTQAYNQEGQNTTSKGDSFSVKKPLDAENESLNSLEAMVNRGQNYLLTQVGNRIRQLRPFKARIENVPVLSDADRSSIVSELNAEIEMLETLKTEVSQSKTKEDIRNVADKIKAEWLKSRQSVERAEGLVLASKETQLISDADAASLGIQKKIDALKAEGKDAKPFEEMLATYSKKVASAKQDVESAKEKSNAVTSASSDAEKEKLVKEKNLLLKSSQENIRDAYKILGDEARKDFSRRMP